LAYAGDDLAVDGELDGAVIGLDAIMVPFAAALAAVLAGQAALLASGVRAVGLARGAVDAEEIAVAGGSRVALFVLVEEIDEHLHLDAARVGRADGRQGIGPHEE